jgi:hypothetical protein
LKNFITLSLVRRVSGIHMNQLSVKYDSLHTP